MDTAVIDVSDEELYIVNVIPNDFNYDGKLDVLIMATKEKTDKPNNELIMRLYLGNQESFGSISIFLFYFFFFKKKNIKIIK